MTDRSTNAPLLVAVDFSKHAEAALLWTADAAPRFESPFVVLHVIHDPGNAPGYYLRAREQDVGSETPPLQQIEAAAKKRMDEFLADVCSRHPDIGKPEDLETRLIVGIPASRILEIAEEIGASMIVMGSQGRTGLSHALLGSKAERVARLSKIPVTIVKI